MKWETSIKHNRNTFIHNLGVLIINGADECDALEILGVGIHWTLGHCNRHILSVSQRCLFRCSSFLFSMRVKRKNVSETVRRRSWASRASWTRKFRGDRRFLNIDHRDRLFASSFPEGVRSSSCSIRTTFIGQMVRLLHDHRWRVTFGTNDWRRNRRSSQWKCSWQDLEVESERTEGRAQAAAAARDPSRSDKRRTCGFR